jgi:hypothetical protein
MNAAPSSTAGAWPSSAHPSRRGRSHQRDATAPSTSPPRYRPQRVERSRSSAGCACCANCAPLLTFRSRTRTAHRGASADEQRRRLVRTDESSTAEDRAKNCSRSRKRRGRRCETHVPVRARRALTFLAAKYEFRPRETLARAASPRSRVRGPPRGPPGDAWLFCPPERPRRRRRRHSNSRSIAVSASAPAPARCRAVQQCASSSLMPGALDRSPSVADDPALDDASGVVERTAPSDPLSCLAFPWRGASLSRATRSWSSHRHAARGLLGSVETRAHSSPRCFELGTLETRQRIAWRSRRPPSAANLLTRSRCDDTRRNSSVRCASAAARLPCRTACMLCRDDSPSACGAVPRRCAHVRRVAEARLARLSISRWPARFRL